MRQRSKQNPERGTQATGHSAQAIRPEPLAEGISGKRAQRRWASMGDDELLDYARKTIHEKGIRDRKGLMGADSGLYCALNRRGLLGQAGLETNRKQRKWGDDGEVLQFARRLVLENGIRSRKGLENADAGLYRVMRERKLLCKIGFAESTRKWGADSEVLEYARSIIERGGILSRNGLKSADEGLYIVLRKRNLIESLRFVRTVRKWGCDEEVLDFAQETIEKRGIRNRSALEKADCGLYAVLRKRNILRMLEFKAGNRRWGEDGEVMASARRLIEGSGIRTREELQKADSGLYGVLYARGLLDSVGLAEKRPVRSWGADEDVEAFARRFVAEKGIATKAGLSKADKGLYCVLQKRGLLDEVGLRKKKPSRRWGSDAEVLASARKLIEVGGIRNRAGLIKADSGLSKVLRQRGLLDDVDFAEKRREWGTDAEVLAFARQLMEKEGIRSRAGLEKRDLGLCLVLRKRKLLDAAFSDTENAKSIESEGAILQGIKEALGEYSGDEG